MCDGHLPLISMISVSVPDKLIRFQEEIDKYRYHHISQSYIISNDNVIFVSFNKPLFVKLFGFL